MNNCISISWIYHQFIALHIKHGKAISQWSSPTDVNNLIHFEQALSLACKEFKIRKGSDIVIAYEAEDHLHTRITTPKMALRDTKKYLIRQLKKLNDDSPPAWSYQISTQSITKQSIVLHTLPGETFSTLCKLCDANNLVLRRLVPLADLATLEYANTHNKKNSSALLILIFESKTQMMIINTNNEALVIRELNYHWSENDNTRICTDINRSILYTKQQFNIHIANINIFGPDSIQAHEAIKSYIDIPISINDKALKPCFWANTASALPLKSSSNFVPTSMQHKITSLHLYKMSKWASLSLPVAALCIVFFVESLVSQYGSISSRELNSVTELEQQLQTLKQKNSIHLSNINQQQLMTLNKPLVALWFTERLDQLLTDKTTLSRVKVEQKNDSWEFMIEGYTQAGYAQSHDILQSIENKLTGSPWNAQVSPAWKNDWLEKLHSGDALKDTNISFIISGNMQ